MSDLPHGVVTFLFSDVEGSTRLLETQPEQAGPALAQHHELLAAAMQAASGTVFETVGDAVYAAFQDAPDAARAALAGQQALAEHDWGPVPRLRVRMAIHTGEVETRGSHYFGAPLFRCARLQSLAYGDQTLISATAADLIQGDVPRGSELTDLGWLRLKDLDEPEHVFQLDGDGLPREFPPLRSIGEAKHNLPAEFSSFVGREQILGSLRRSVADPGVVVVVGPGGVGKTRLAIHLAREVVGDFPAGCCFVELAPLTLASESIPALATALHLRETPGRSIQEVVDTFLADKRMLIVLDNAEHLTDIGAPIRDLAASAPLASILITSRIKLNLPGATHTTLEPMTVEATAADGSTSPAVALLADRVRSFDQSFELSPLNLPVLVEICTRVDGLPLGLELVAPNVAGLGARETLDALGRQQFRSSDIAPDGDRHASLTATVAWSYGLLDAGTRDLFAQLSVFVGSFDAAAARAVGLRDPEETDRGLLKLISSSLLGSVEGVADERRFSMLVTVQDFARSLVTPADLPELEARHAAYFEQMAAVAAGAIFGPDQGTWPTRMALELPNLRAALAWQERSDPDGLLEFATNVARCWDLAGMNTEGRSWLVRALAEHQQPDAARARGLRWLGVMSEHQGDLASATRTYRELSALQRKLGDGSGLADAQRGMAGVAALRGRRHEAVRLVEQALVRHRQDGDLAMIVDGLAQLTLMELEAGDSELAMAHATEMERLSREIGNKSGIAVARHHLARGLRQSGRMREAETAAKDALVLFKASDDASFAPYSLLNLAWIELALGDLEEAHRRLCQALARTRQMEEPGSLPRLLEARAALAAVSGDDGLAQRIVEAADAIRDRNHLPRNRSDSRELRRYVKAKGKHSPAAGPTPAEIDHLVQFLLEDCRQGLGDSLASTATLPDTDTRKPTRGHR